MIEIHSEQGNGYSSIEVTGHAGSAPHGEDLVCCAVSTILNSAILSLKSLGYQYPEYIKVTGRVHEPIGEVQRLDEEARSDE